MSKIDEVVTLLQTMSDEDKVKLIESFQKQLNITPLKEGKLISEEPVKKKRGRPPKKKTSNEEISVNAKKDSTNLFNESEILDDPDVKKATKLDQKLKSLGKKEIKQVVRPAIKFVKARCVNCQKEFSVPENFPNIKGFVCCVK